MDANKYRPACSAKAADGAIRGTLIGVIWGGFFSPVAADTGTSVSGAAARVLSAGGSAVRHGVGFASFLAMFNGITCCAEQVRGDSGALNHFIGGAAAGAMISMRVRNPLHIAAVSLGTGCVTAGISVLRGPGGAG